MCEKFKQGAVVQFEGGPEMVVLGYGEYLSRSSAKQYLCRWLDKRHDPLEGIFAEADLKAVTTSIE
jgi:uncharacterized protein YodC (DUF2158 family)